MFRSRGVGGRAFDAATASGLAFLNSQLELIVPELIKPMESVTHARDITVEFGGGFAEFVSAWASNYATTGGNQYGLQGTSNTDIAMVQADVQKGNWRTFNWAAGIFISLIDLKRLEMASKSGSSAPFSLQELLEDGVKSVWNKALDRVTYLGWNGFPGLINQSYVPETSALTNSNSHVTWAAKMGDTSGPVDILRDFNLAINTVTANSGYDIDEGMPDTALIPWAQYGLLTVPMALNNVGTYESVIKYIEKNCVAAQHGKQFRIFPLPGPWIAGQGVSGTDRMLVYKNDRKAVRLKVPQPMQKALTMPTTAHGGGFETIFNGCVGQVMYTRNSTGIYVDGI